MLSNPLLATKFQAPPLRPNRVERARLIDKLEQGYQSGSRLTLICAPAGYGKTTLAVEWLQRVGRRFAWLGLDETENDPGLFFTCLVTTLQTLAPELGMSTLSMLGVPTPPPVENIIGELINEISAVDGDFVLALDDYHHIHNATIHDALEALLAHQPANLHLLVTTREDPAFPLSRLRARGQLSEIRVRDLRFTGEETRDFLSQVHRLNLPQPAVEKLAHITEGWAAGLQLTGLAFQNEEDAENFFDTFSGAHQYIIEYLLDEVLRRQSEAVRSFLTSTAILERFNASLCAAVVGDTHGEEPLDCRAVLAALEHANLFLTPLDAAHEWFRYHRLFADVLRADLEPQREVELHTRAAVWFEAHDLPAEAIPHYLAAGATQAAGRLIRRLAGNLVQHGELQTLLRWTRALPAEELQADPTLLAYQALALMLTGDLAGSFALLQTAIPQAQGHEGYGALLSVRAWLFMVSSQHDGLQELAQQALAVLPPDETIFRVLGLLVLGDSFFSNHNIAASTEAYQEAYLLGLRTQHPFAALAGLANFVFNLFDMGQLRRARGLCLDAQARFTDSRGKPLPVLGMVDVPLSAIYLELRDLPQAAAFARRGQELCQKLFSSGMMGGDAEVVLAAVAFLEGRRDEAFQILAEMRRFAAERHVTALEDKMTIAEADLHLREGDTGAARACLDRLEIRAHGFAPVVSFTRQIHLAEILLAEGQPEAALETIAPLEADYRRQGNIRRLIRLLGLQAGALQMLSQLTEAAATLEEAVHLAAPEGYLSALLRAPEPAAALLPAVRAAAPEFVDQALALLPARPVSPAAAAPITVAPSAAATPKVNPQPVIQPPPSAAAELVEPLSDQERKILRLLVAGRSNQEIAEELYISAGTVKWHVHNILGKLDVSSRSQAAAKARDLGLL